MRRRLTRFLASLGALTALLILLLVALAIVQASRTRIPKHTVLELHIDEQLVEEMPTDTATHLLYIQRTVVRDLVDAIDRASRDDRVRALLVRLSDVSLGMAVTQELRDAILAFRAKNKRAIAYADSFGEFGAGNGAYYLATACDQIWMQPSGDVGLTGIMAESVFLRGVFDKLGVVPRMDHRYEYKNAMNMFTEKKYTPAHREATEKLINSFYGQLARAVAQARHLSEAEVRALVDRAPLLGREAVDARLVDGLAYGDEVYDRVKKSVDSGAKFLYVEKYLQRVDRPHSSGKTVALIFGVGGVHRGKSSFDPLLGEQSMGSDTVTRAFREAIDNKAVKAILFRVDSPGGSYVASDAIWRETIRARSAGKPVIVSMGNVAGSGGYFVAMAADKIVAQPGTITGSIGVLGGKLVTRELWDKLGISFDEVHVGANADMWTGTHDYTKAEWARFEAWLDRVYTDFTNKVADGRKLPKERVLQIARGRIWTGEDAKEIGLVDALGGYSVALSLTKKAAGIPEGEDVKLTVFPARKSTLQQLIGEDDDSSQPAAAFVQVLARLRPFLRQLAIWTQPAERQTLSMPGSELLH